MKLRLDATPIRSPLLLIMLARTLSLGKSSLAAQHFISSTPTFIAIMADAVAIEFLLRQRMPKLTSLSAGILSFTSEINSANSSGSITSSSSQRVIVFIPESIAKVTISFKKSGSARVASAAKNSTLLDFSVAAVKSCFASSSIFAGFLWQVYSI